MQVNGQNYLPTALPKDLDLGKLVTWLEVGNPGPGLLSDEKNSIPHQESNLVHPFVACYIIF
jgi:hypothetical protein